MAGRPLAPRLSDVDIGPNMPMLEEWQMRGQDTVQQLFNNAFQERVHLTKSVCSFPAPDVGSALKTVAMLAQKCCSLGSLEAEQLALSSLRCQAGGEAANGITFVSPLAWSYGVKSLWRGITDSKKLCRLTRSILNGFRNGEPIQSRSIWEAPPGSAIYFLLHIYIYIERERYCHCMRIDT